MSEEKKDLTLGEKRARVKFNPSNNEVIHLIKSKAAELINLVSDIESYNEEAVRIKEFAIKDIESASMWAIRAVYT